MSILCGISYKLGRSQNTLVTCRKQLDINGTIGDAVGTVHSSKLTTPVAVLVSSLLLLLKVLSMLGSLSLRCAETQLETRTCSSCAQPAMNLWSHQVQAKHVLHSVTVMCLIAAM